MITYYSKYKQLIVLGGLSILWLNVLSSCSALQLNKSQKKEQEETERWPAGGCMPHKNRTIKVDNLSIDLIGYEYQNKDIEFRKFVKKNYDSVVAVFKAQQDTQVSIVQDDILQASYFKYLMYKGKHNNRVAVYFVDTFFVGRTKGIGRAIAYPNISFSNKLKCTRNLTENKLTYYNQYKTKLLTFDFFPDESLKKKNVFDQDGDDSLTWEWTNAGVLKTFKDHYKIRAEFLAKLRASGKPFPKPAPRPEIYYSVEQDWECKGGLEKTKEIIVEEVTFMARHYGLKEYLHFTLIIDDNKEIHIEINQSYANRSRAFIQKQLNEELAKRLDCHTCRLNGIRLKTKLSVRCYILTDDGNR